MKHKHYVNLSNGILAIEDYGLTEYSFIRLQSTQCEQNNLQYIIHEISTDLLMHLALGDTLCHLYDYGSRSGDKPRAFWLGMEWIKYVLYRIWFPEGEEYMPELGKSQQQYFRREYCNIPKRIRGQIKYYRRWLPGNSGKLHIKYHCKMTIYDGKYEYMKKVLKQERG